MNTKSGAKSSPSASITCSAAVELIEAAHEAAHEIGFEAAVAITDTGGHLMAFQRADGARFLSAEVALAKAWTAVSSALPTHTWNSIVAVPEASPLAHHPRLMAVAGGYPVFENGRIIGGLGVAGGSAEQDQQAAEAALSALSFEAPA